MDIDKRIARSGPSKRLSVSGGGDGGRPISATVREAQSPRNANAMTPTIERVPCRRAPTAGALV
jgi:hypothetical protein